MKVKHALQVFLFLLIALAIFQIGSGLKIASKAWLSQELIQTAWAKTLSGNQQVQPWPWADTWPVAKLSAIGHDIDLIVLAGGSGRTLAFGPGYLTASSMPGERGNTVIAGHRDTHFNFLQDVEIGESFVIETAVGRKHLYKVVSIDVVDSRRGALQLDTAEQMLSLVTCYPFDAVEPGGPMRYVVTARMLF